MNNLWQRKIVRFICVGIINTITDLAILNVLVFAFNLKLLVANLISASISIVISYFWNHTIVFQRQHELSLRLFLKFVVVTGISILAVQSLIIYGVEHIVSVKEITRLTNISGEKAKFIHVNVAKLFAVAGGMAWNFVLYNLVVFKTPSKKPDIDDEGFVPY